MPAMPTHAALLAHLRRWDRRWRAGQSVTWAVRGLTAGLGVGLLIALAGRLWPLFAVPGLVALATVWALIGAANAALVAWFWPRSTLVQARAFDRRLGLQERMSTALEAHSGAIAPPDWLTRRQLADALAVAGRVQLAVAMPLRLERVEWLRAALALALLAAALWLPNPMQSVVAEREAVRQAIQEEVQALEALRAKIEADPRLAEEDRQGLLEALDDVVQQLSAGDLTREEALAELTEASERLRELSDPQAEQQAAGLSEAGEGLKDSSITNALSKALTKGDYLVAAAVLEDLSNDVGQELTREQELELASELADAAEALAESNPELSQQLADAAQAIQEGDISAAREALAEASQTMAGTGQQIAASQAAQEAAAQAAQGGQQVAQAGGQGTQGGDQPGSGGQGTDGDGAASGAGSGEGQGEAAGGAASPMEGGDQDGDGGERLYESIFAPRRLGGEGGPEMELSWGDDPGELLREIAADPEMGSSQVPYDRVYADYVRAANRALDDQRIPLGLRGYVRDYFSSLEP